MKIIKTEQQDWKKRINCRVCKAVLEIVGEDIRYGLYVQLEDTRKGDYYVECGVCDKPIVIKEKDIPGFVTEDVIENRKDN